MIAVLDYGIGNLRSAEKALQRQGADARLVTDPEEAAAAAGVVLPGVGAFGPCMDALVTSGLDRAVRAAVATGVPFLGICVGMQLLYEGSDESPQVDGLGLLPGVVRRLGDGVKRPQMQWNRLVVHQPDALLAGAMFEGPVADPWVYFVHSYVAPLDDCVVASCDYGGPVAAVVARDGLRATQFHPEKSGATGLALLANFIALVAAGPGAAGAAVSGPTGSGSAGSGSAGSGSAASGPGVSGAAADGRVAAGPGGP